MCGWGDVIGVLVRPACMVVQTEGGPGRPMPANATHLLIFSDEDFYLRLIHSFHPMHGARPQPRAKSAN